MSSYIAGILDRSLKPLARIRPRIAMLFEPVRDRPTTSWSTREQGGRLEEHDEVGATTHNPGAARIPEGRDRLDNPPSDERVGQMFPDPGASARSGQRRTQLTPADPTERTRGDGVHRGALSLPLAAKDSPQMYHVGEQDRTMHMGRTPGAENQRRPEDESSPRLRGAFSVERETRPAHRQIGQQELPPKLTPRLQPRGIQQFLVEKRSPEPETTVHVTIGRIEVHAEQLPEPSRRTPAKPPAAMSLEEYLSRRSKRGLA